MSGTAVTPLVGGGGVERVNNLSRLDVAVRLTNLSIVRLSLISTGYLPW